MESMRTTQNHIVSPSMASHDAACNQAFREQTVPPRAMEGGCFCSAILRDLLCRAAAGGQLFSPENSQFDMSISVTDSRHNTLH